MASHAAWHALEEEGAVPNFLPSEITLDLSPLNPLRPKGTPESSSIPL